MPRKTVYNRIARKEILALVSKENHELIDDFIDFCKSTDKSELTIVNYRSDMNIFLTWNYMYNNDKFFPEYTRRDIMRYQGTMLNEWNHSPARIRRLKSTLSSLSEYIENMLDDVYPDFRNLVNKIPPPKPHAVRPKTVLSDEQVEHLLDVLVEEEKYMEACLFSLAVSSGARKSELLRFKVHFFDEENIVFGSLYKTPEKIKTKGSGRRGTLLHKYILKNRFMPYFDLWMKERERQGITSEYLFAIKEKDGNEKLCMISMITTMFNYFSEVLGVPMYPHCLRHFCCTHMHESGLPAEVIKDLFGWKSVEMVSVYTDTDIDAELEKYFDENGIKAVEKKGLGDL